ncbi:MAG: M3 family oligoendopeptidase [Rhodospirillaceae bacterium]
MNDSTLAPRPKKDFGELPTWNLTDLYSSPDGADLKAAFKEAERQIDDFVAVYTDKVSGLDSAAFGAAIAAYEAISELLGRIGSFAQLYHSQNVEDSERGRFYQNTVDRMTTLSSKTLFFTLAINRLEEDVLDAKLTDPSAAKYKPWLRDLRVYKDHELSDDLERLLHEKYVSGRGAWTRLFDQTEAAIRCDVNGETVTLTEALNTLSDSKPERRRAAAKGVGKALGEKASQFAYITNVLAKDKSIEDGWRKYAKPVSSRNLANLVEDDVVDALVSASKDSYPTTSHRYYSMKAKWFGKDKLDYWDRNAPLPSAESRIIKWDEAKTTVLEAYSRFSPRLAEPAAPFFENGWIDAPASPGKASGAFAHPTVPSVHPYLLVNYLGSSRDVMTLAHELGHGVHQVLAGAQGTLLCDTPLTLAETASVFGEMLTFRSLLDKEDRPAQRRALLAGKVEDMLNTVVRQIAFHQFETQIHDERRDGEISLDRMCEIWLKVQSDSLGPAFTFDEEYKYYWTYISHFVHVPFYVYAYAFGDCLVNSLYKVYTEKTVPDFEDKYIEMLKAGGTKRHKELLAPFGLDASDPAFWARGMETLTGLIDELEEVA